jgi:hypothetical protein
MRTSDVLKLGSVYTRNQLKDDFSITDKTLYTGVFRPPTHDSIWLFVTAKKSEDMTKYVDRLDGDILYWQGQLAGHKDSSIIDHAKNGLELVVFYRPSEHHYSASGFRFEGPFEYKDHSGKSPTDFILQRTKGNTAIKESPAMDDDALQKEQDCLVDVLAQLRQAGVDAVVTEGRLTNNQRQLHVEDRIEGWVAERIVNWRSKGKARPLLVVLSGNAGDGKSQLIERLRSRAETIEGDTDIVADATHSEAPSQSQAERLVEKFTLFADTPPDPESEPRCVVIAINVGMVIAFFAALSESDRNRFSKLRGLLEYGLGLDPTPNQAPEHWDCEVVNLDHRNVLGDNETSLFSGMLSKLDPEDADSLTHDAARGCLDCAVRSSCWVRTNLNLLRLPAVKLALHELLWEASLTSEYHLTPRNLWDFLFETTTGGLELPIGVAPDGQFLSCDWMRSNLPKPRDQFSSETFQLVHRRLNYHLLFETPHASQLSRSPLLKALEAVDPIRAGGKHTNSIEGEVRATPRADSQNLSELALEADELIKAGQRQPDPLLDRLASVVTDPVFIEVIGEENAQQLALGVSRRARLTGLPAEVQAEVTDSETSDFLELLKSYAGWTAGSKHPEAVNLFWIEQLIGGVGRIFGMDFHGKTYFRLETLSPATRFPAYVAVDLWSKITIVPDPGANSGAAWLDALAYVPRTLTALVDTGGQEPWEIPVDLRLFRLLRKVEKGYSASSFDLEAFFRLRYACERLGPSDSKQIVFRGLENGDLWILERKQLGNWTSTKFGQAEK